MAHSSTVFHGPQPEPRQSDEREVGAAVRAWIDRCLKDGIAPETIAVLVRSDAELLQSRAAITVLLSGEGIRAALMRREGMRVPRRRCHPGAGALVDLGKRHLF